MTYIFMWGCFGKHPHANIYKFLFAEGNATLCTPHKRAV